MCMIPWHPTSRTRLQQFLRRSQNLYEQGNPKPVERDKHVLIQSKHIRDLNRAATQLTKIHIHIFIYIHTRLYQWIWWRSAQQKRRNIHFRYFPFQFSAPPPLHRPSTLTQFSFTFSTELIESAPRMSRR